MALISEEKKSAGESSKKEFPCDMMYATRSIMLSMERQTELANLVWLIQFQVI